MKDRSCRGFIANMIRDMRKTEGIPYIRGIEDSLGAVAEEMEKYEKRHPPKWEE